MRVLLTGTSNSILIGGLRTAFENSAEISKFSNYSYGASGTVALGDHLSKIDFSQYDFCVLDYCVNEEVLIYMEQSKTELAMNSFLCAIDAMSRAGCQPIILVLPSRTRMGFARPFEVAIEKVYGAKCVPIFNFYDLAARMICSSKIAFSDLFIDIMHIQRNLAQFVAKTAISYMREVFDSNQSARMENVGHDFSELAFVSFANVQTQGNSEYAQRATRWLTRDVLRIESGTEVSFALPYSADLIGISYNAARSVGELIHVETGLSVFKSPASKHFTNARELTAMALPVERLIPIELSSINLRYECREIVDESMPPVAFELIGFICKRTELSNKAKVLIRDNHPRKLADEIDDAEIEKLITSLKNQNIKND